MTQFAPNAGLLFADEFQWSLEHYHRMIEAGVLDEDDRIELLYGKIIKMSPVGRFHATSVRKINKLLVKRLSDRYTCSQEQPIAILPRSEPEPDYILATYRDDDYLNGHPEVNDIHLLIEVSDKTLRKDREVKMVLYAQAGIKEYWIVNLIERQLEIYLNPVPAGTFDDQLIYAEDDAFEHEIVGTLKIRQLLP